MERRMKTPELIDSGELDASIAALDAIKQPDEDLLQERINSTLYWYEAMHRDFTDFDITILRTACLQENLARIGAVILKRELSKGRKYVEPTK
jgi:hypothetical protein